MRKRSVVLAIVVIGGALLVASLAVAAGGKRSLKADDMIGYLEAPPVSTAARGTFEAEIDDDASLVHYRLSYSGLEGDVRQAHIHFGQRSVSAGIIVWLCETTFNPSPTGPATPDCPQSGTVTGTVGSTDVIGPTGQGIAAGEFKEFVDAMRAGRAYANVHSFKFPGGEVRGQINDKDQKDD